MLLWTAVACSDAVDMPDSLQPDAPGTITIRLRNSEFSRSQQSDNSEVRIENLYVGLYDSDDNTKPAVVWASYPSVRKSGEAVVTLKLTDELIDNLFRNSADGKCRVAVLANISYPNTVADYASVNDMRQLAVTSPFDTEKVQQSFVMEGEGELEYEEATGDSQGKAAGTVMLYRAAAKMRLNIGFPQNVEIKDAEGNVVERWTPVTDENAVIALLNNGVKSSVAVPVASDGETWAPGEDTEYYSSDLSKEATFRTFSTGGTTAYPYVMDVPFYTYPNSWSESAEETGKTTITLIVPWHKEGEAPGSNTTFYYQIPVTSDDVTSIDRNTSYKIDLTLGMLGSITPDTPVEVKSLTYEVIDWGSDDVDTAIPAYRYLVVSSNTYTVNNDNSISIPFYTTHKTIISDIEMVYQRFNYPADGSGEVVDITIPKSVIDRSTYQHTVNGRIQTDTICNYSIERDLSGQMYVRIEHPMIMWDPKNSSGQDVSLTLQSTPIQQQVAKIYRYTYPTSNPQTAYFPYIIKLTICHEDNPLFHEEVTITQYPAMYIEADMNEGGYYRQYNPSAASDFSDGNIISENHGYTYLNAALRHDTSGGVVWQVSNINYAPYLTVQNPRPTTEQVVDYLTTGLGGLRAYVAPSVGSGLVNNYNMYVINITQLSEDDGNYIIADTRAKFVNNNLYAEGTDLKENTADAGDWCKPAAALYDGAQMRKLRYYHPTDESEMARWKIAPKLRVSSSFGYVVSQPQLSYKTLCRRRCATYQERGYPAGRWRLPTYGEVSFICKLSGEGKIPVLFRVGEVYMTAQGPYEVLSNGSLASTPTEKDVSDNLWWSNVNKRWQVRSTAVGYNVRPVYDEWYWENEEEYVLEQDQSGGYLYTLGDVPVKFN